MSTIRFRIIQEMFLLSICLVSAMTYGVQAQEISFSKIAVLVSQEIKPYVEAVEGFSNTFSRHSDIDVEIFILEKFTEKSRNVLKDKLIQEPFHLFIAVGPVATRFANSELRNTGTPLLYTMVLNPENLTTSCGIPLNIPIPIQIRNIASSLPFLKKIGLLYDPAYNASFFKEAAESSDFSGLTIVPLEISSKKKITAKLQEHWDKIDGLWLIPDRTVISESIVQYIIKKAILKKIPVIGYNRFFYESGAALAFVFDYKEIGIQTAELALKMLSGKPCSETVPEFDTYVNIRVLKKLGIEVKK